MRIAGISRFKGTGIALQEALLVVIHSLTNKIFIRNYLLHPSSHEQCMIELLRNSHG
jgi:hypothetical protein